MSDAASRGRAQVVFHVVRSGESLSRIAGDHGVGLHDVITANPQIANPALIRPGQRINLPKGAHAHTGLLDHAPAAPPPARPVRPSPTRDACATAAPNAPSIAPGVSAHGFDFIYQDEHVDGISERLHWPQGSSGVTIGSGYGRRYRTADQIVRDLTSIGVSGAEVRAAAGETGLSGQDASDFGHRNHDAIVLTDVQERRLLAKAIGPAVETINQSVTVPLTQNQRDALASLVFNIGGPGFRGSDVRRRLNQQDYATVLRHPQEMGTPAAKLPPCAGRCELTGRSWRHCWSPASHRAPRQRRRSPWRPAASAGRRSDRTPRWRRYGPRCRGAFQQARLTDAPTREPQRRRLRLRLRLRLRVMEGHDLLLTVTYYLHAHGQPLASILY